MRRRAFAATPVLAAILVSGCSPAAAPTPTPTATPTTYTCIDDGLRKAGTCSQADFQAQQKEQATFKEAQATYQEFLSERNRVAHLGGADSATPRMKDLAIDPFLGQVVGFLQQQKKDGRRVEGDLIARDFAVERSKARPDSTIAVRFCEDGTATHAWTADGKPLTSGRIARTVAYFKRQGDQLMVFDWDGEVVDSCGA